MADREAKRAFENEEKNSIESNDSEQKNEAKFKKATAKLKTEALRRFQLKEQAKEEEEDFKVKIFFLRMLALPLGRSTNLYHQQPQSTTA